jgi:SAM-dependent methyltransferase
LGRFARIGQAARRLSAIVADEGPLEAARRLLRRARPDRGFGDYLAAKAARDAAFDSTHDSDTGGVQRLYTLAIDSPNARYGIDHVATDPDVFAAAVALVDGDLARFHFLDLGSGKGRALLLACDYPFRAVTGVEFAAELHATATRNLTRRGDPRATALLGDATAVALPEGDLLVYLFNPFEEAIIRAVARRLAALPPERDVRLLYVNPRHRDVLAAESWRVAAAAGEAVLFRRD